LTYSDREPAPQWGELVTRKGGSNLEIDKKSDYKPINYE
jgi:hypothetical protein